MTDHPCSMCGGAAEVHVPAKLAARLRKAYDQIRPRTAQSFQTYFENVITRQLDADDKMRAFAADYVERVRCFEQATAILRDRVPNPADEEPPGGDAHDCSDRPCYCDKEAKP